MPSELEPSLVWFRLDLRLADNPALEAALDTGRPIVPVYLWTPGEEASWRPGGASRWWLHHSLARLDEALRLKGSRLILRHGPALEALRTLSQETGARTVFWNRRYEPAVIARDSQVKEGLKAEGFRVESFNGTLLNEPWEIRNQAGSPFRVFTPYWRACLARMKVGSPTREPEALPSPRRWPRSVPLEALNLLPRIPWDGGLKAAWNPGEERARVALTAFMSAGFPDYNQERDRPGVCGTSRISPHLHFGELGPRQVWHAAQRAAARGTRAGARWEEGRFLAELGWREFAHHLLFHFPSSPEQPLRPPFEAFPWRQDAASLEAWKKGVTGIPLVDAGMRELWATGWMHNRVRMVAGSFLVKNLLCSWREGATWFWDTLVDADLANNTLGWQWVAGCGADAAPFFRIFNPVSQGVRFDPDGDYIRRWVPQLGKVPAKFIHAPWTASPTTLGEAGVTLGVDYPHPIVSLSASRIAALVAFARLRGAEAPG